MNSAITGTPVQNLMRQAGRYAGGILPLGIEAGAGLATGHPGIAAGIGAAGLASRFASTQMAKNAAEALRQTITVGGGLPDLISTSISYASGNFTSVVSNQGNAATPAFVPVGVAYNVDGVKCTWGFVDGPLAAGASVTIGTQGGACPI